MLIKKPLQTNKKEEEILVERRREKANERKKKQQRIFQRRKGETEEERGKDQIGKRKAENEFELWSEEINIYTFGVNYLLKNAW